MARERYSIPLDSTKQKQRKNVSPRDSEQQTYDTLGQKMPHKFGSASKVGMPVMSYRTKEAQENHLQEMKTRRDQEHAESAARA